MRQVPYNPANSPLGHDAPLDYQAQFPLLGIPLVVRSNSPSVIAAAVRSFGHWHQLEPEQIALLQPLLISLVVHSRGQPEMPRAPFVQRAYGTSFLAASGSNLLTAEMDRGVALGFVTPELVADDLHFRYNVLECLALLLASWYDRTPVHAGAVTHNGCAVLLAGRSMAGKSTLCYACVRAGFQLLAEDVVYVSTRQGLRLWGNPGRIHLLPDARRHFRELVDIAPQVQANGKLKLAIDVVASGADRVRPYAERAVVCLLQRHNGLSSMLEPIDPQEVVATLSQEPEAGFDLHRQGLPQAAAALAHGGAYRLSMGRDLAGTVAVLRRLME